MRHNRRDQILRNGSNMRRVQVAEKFQIHKWCAALTSHVQSARRSIQTYACTDLLASMPEK